MIPRYNNWEKIGFIEGRGTTTETSFYSFEDKKLPPGKYNYRIKQIDYDGTYKYYNLSETVTTLVNEAKEPGIYEAKFDASLLSSGIYFYTLRAGDFTQTKKM